MPNPNLKPFSLAVWLFQTNIEFSEDRKKGPFIKER